MSGGEALVSEDAALMNCIDQQCAAMFSDGLQWSYLGGDSSDVPRSC